MKKKVGGGEAEIRKLRMFWKHLFGYVEKRFRGWDQFVWANPSGENSPVIWR